MADKSDEKNRAVREPTHTPTTYFIIIPFSETEGVKDPFVYTKKQRKAHTLSPARILWLIYALSQLYTIKRLPKSGVERALVEELEQIIETEPELRLPQSAQQ